jgi:hypothetical protein
MSKKTDHIPSALPPELLIVTMVLEEHERYGTAINKKGRLALKRATLGFLYGGCGYVELWTLMLDLLEGIADAQQTMAGRPASPGSPGDPATVPQCGSPPDT